MKIAIFLGVFWLLIGIGSLLLPEPFIPGFQVGIILGGVWNAAVIVMANR